VYPSSRYLTPKVRAFIDLALERFPRAKGYAAIAPHAVLQTDAPSQRRR